MLLEMVLRSILGTIHRACCSCKSGIGEAGGIGLSCKSVAMDMSVKVTPFPIKVGARGISHSRRGKKCPP